MKQKRKMPWKLWLCLLVPALLLGYYLSALFILPDVTITNFTDRLAYAMLHPWPPMKYYNGNTGKCMLGMFTVWLVACTAYYANMKNYMFGKEYGSAEWADIGKFNKALADWSGKGRKKAVTANNRILSRNARISYDSSKTLLNNNQTVVGGSGSGKTAFIMSPNLLQFHGSNVYTDPKGGMLEDFGKILEEKGVVIKSINLCDMDQSMQYNPFNYIRKQSDVQKLITNLIANTTPAEAIKADPFWDKAETLYLTAIFDYVWMECPRTEKVHRKDRMGMIHKEEITLERNFRTVLYLLDEAEVPQDSEKVSPLTKRMEKLADESPLHEKHPAVRNYYKCIRGAGDTVRSIIISANSRFAPFDNEDLLRMLDDDDMELGSIGIGVDGDEKTKTALFCIIPDDDTTFNFVIGMLYTQLFQELYRLARFYDGKRLPLDVGFWFDEFANIKMPSMFDKILATCRSRGIYCTVVLQSLAQIKALYKDSWEGLIGNCDTLIYLGGNEPSSHKYVSEQLGKWTIDKRSTRRTFGSRGSSSKNEDILGRELMTPDEVKNMDNNYSIVFVRGQNPIYDRKWFLFTAPEYRYAKSLGIYRFRPEIKKDVLTGRLTTVKSPQVCKVLSKESAEYYKNCAQRGENVKFLQMTEGQFAALDLKEHEDGAEETLAALERDKEKLQNLQKQLAGQQEKLTRQKAEDSALPVEIDTSKLSLLDMIMQFDYTDEQMRQIRLGMKAGLDEERIKQYAAVENSAAKMELLREFLMESK